MAILSEERQTRVSGDEWVMYKVLNDENNANVTSSEIDIRNAKAITLVVETSSNASGGAVDLEGGVTSGYTGTWKQLVTLGTLTSSKVFSGAIDIAADLPLKYARARITGQIGAGGTVDVYIIVQY